MYIHTGGAMTATETKRKREGEEDEENKIRSGRITFFLFLFSFRDRRRRSALFQHWLIKFPIIKTIVVHKVEAHHQRKLRLREEGRKKGWH